MYWRVVNLFHSFFSMIYISEVFHHAFFLISVFSNRNIFKIFIYLLLPLLKKMSLIGTKFYMERVIKSKGTKTFRSKKCERQIQDWNITALLWRHAIGSVLRPWSFRLLGVSNFSTPHLFSHVLTWEIQNEDSLDIVFYWLGNYVDSGPSIFNYFL